MLLLSACLSTRGRTNSFGYNGKVVIEFDARAAGETDDTDLTNTVKATAANGLTDEASATATAAARSLQSRNMCRKTPVAQASYFA